MKNLWNKIWNAPASTIAGGISASIGVIITRGDNVPDWALVTMLAVAAFLGFFSGTSNTTESKESSDDTQDS